MGKPEPLAKATEGAPGGGLGMLRTTAVHSLLPAAATVWLVTVVGVLSTPVAVLLNAETVNMLVLRASVVASLKVTVGGPAASVKVGVTPAPVASIEPSVRGRLA